MMRPTFRLQAAFLEKWLIQHLLDAAHPAGGLRNRVLVSLLQAAKIRIVQLGGCQLLPYLVWHASSSIMPW
jgi:hypothetical protein